MIDKPTPPLKGLNLRNPMIIPIKGRRLIHQGSALGRIRSVQGGCGSEAYREERMYH